MNNNNTCCCVCNSSKYVVGVAAEGVGIHLREYRLPAFSYHCTYYTNKIIGWQNNFAPLYIVVSQCYLDSRRAATDSDSVLSTHIRFELFLKRMCLLPQDEPARLQYFGKGILQILNIIRRK